ncbi:SPOR domain-containing protein [Pontixanthobacter sp.]|uniref:SPOR domain-containing protein n=1 Tax=Pontixanthobacter sp. TaxID=2792078 RepID=UPI003C7C724B
MPFAGTIDAYSRAAKSLAFGGVLAAITLGAPVAAQTSDGFVSREVVQQLPPAEVTKLNAALRKLARNSQDVNALIDAGNASLGVNDIDAAIGFFGRADDLSPNNPRVKLGLAAAFVRTQRPIDALALFNEAERAGVAAGALATDRGLAYDLVGDNASAQQLYIQALGNNSDSETRRRFALSHAITGNRKEFEAVLLPLLEAQDFASYRTRAFGLAILGEEDEAISITEAVMPRDMAARITPYLRYMRRLTKAQQAAAANLGIFPRAAQIGRDTPQIARYAGTARAGRDADARLAPQGEPLGPRPANANPSLPSDGGASAVAAAEPAAEPARVAKVDLEAATDPFTRTRTRNRVPAAVSPSAASPEAAPAQAAAAPPPEPSAPVIAEASTPSISAAPRPDSFDLANVGTRQVEAVTSIDVVASQPAKPESVAEAFANLDLDPGPATRPSGGVDITAIDPPREVERPASATSAQPEASRPEKPDHPRRFWVQIATGKDTSALRFDWRRINRKAGGALDGKGPFVTPWGQSNRLLAGPYDSSRAARNMMNSLKEKEIDSFTFTSPEGQEINTL